MDFGFITRLTAYSLALCKYKAELSSIPAFRCQQIARADLCTIELEPAYAPANKGYALRGILRAANGPALPFNMHYGPLPLALWKVQRYEETQ